MLQSAQSPKETKSNNSPEKKRSTGINVDEMMDGHAKVSTADASPVQRMVKEEEETKQKKSIQKQTAGLENKGSENTSQKSSGNSLPKDIQAKMENAFGTSFSDVSIHQNDNSATGMGALAYTQGNNIHFAPGQFAPESQSGQELIGHELTHVVQQREGRVQPSTQYKEVAINDNSNLENEADIAGSKAAAGEYVSVCGKGSGIQQKKEQEEEEEEEIFGYYMVKKEDVSVEYIAQKVGCSKKELIMVNRGDLIGFDDHPRVRSLLIGKTIRYPNAKRKGVQATVKDRETTIYLTGKILNYSHAGLDTVTLCEKFKKKLVESIENTSDIVMKYKADVDFQVANSMADVSVTDLLLVLVDDVEYDEMLLIQSTNGISLRKGKIAFIEAGKTKVIDTMIHELGHLMGLLDIDTKNPENTNLMSYGTDRSQFSSGQLDETARYANQGKLNLGKNYRYADSDYSAESETSDHEPFLNDVKKGEKIPRNMNNTNIKMLFDYEKKQTPAEIYGY